MSPQASHRRRSGVALVVVLCFLAILAAVAAGLQFVTLSHLRMARITADRERAFFVAEAGVEQAAQYVANGSNVPAAFAGRIGEGAYVATVISGASITDSWHTIGGQININPNNSAQNEFTVTLPDGSFITRDMLTENYPGFVGNPTMVHVKPKGSQSGLTVDGVTYDMNNSSAYDIISDYMCATIYNDHVNTNTGKAMGKWWISIAAAEATIAVDGKGSGQGNLGQARVQYSILAVGTVRGQSRIVLRETLRQKTWAEYAMWMDSNNGIYFIAGEKFYGKVHSNEELGFSGNPEFFDTCTSAATTYNGSIAQCVFHCGFTRGVSAQTLQNIDFSKLRSGATVTLQGATTLAFSGNQVLVTNSRQGWNNYAVACDAPQVIYIQNATTGSSSTRPGDCEVSGTLNGRVTVVCERDASIVGNLVYADDPSTNMLSDDALGIIVKRDIDVETSMPNNARIQAHMIATGQDSSGDGGSFGVVNYSSGSPRGGLAVYGGIIQNNRGAVGTFDTGTGQTTHGYYKNYTYDARFKVDPPPNYPPLSDQLVFGSWKER
jgi:Tfp pilus assembly protein PilX